MRLREAVLLLLVAGSTAAAAPPRAAKPELRPYTPPRLDEEPTPEPGDTEAVMAPDEGDLAIVARPAPGMPLVGTAPAGTVLPVRGAWDAPTGRGCAARRWYAIAPRGWVCAGWVRKTERAPSTEPVMRTAEGRTLPFTYVMVGGPDKGEKLPLWASAEDMRRGAPPAFELGKGDTVAVKPEPLRSNGELFHVAEDDKVLPARPTTFRMGDGSSWAGVPLDDASALPFAWVTPAQASVYDAPRRGARVVERVARRTRLPLLEDAGSGRARFVRVGEDRWMRADDLNEVRLLPRPAGTDTHPRWIDVDLGEQVLVAYEEDRPVFATLVSSGRALPTPRGNYPVWAKVSFITMKSQPYDDEPYYVDRVPWVLFFQAHNALHGAYWHDRFGTTKSHGCVNLAPKDARWLFEWVPPELPAGWSGIREPNLLASVTVHVRNSSLRRPFVQERPIGPPDRQEERQKREEAEARRLAGAAAGDAQPDTAVPAAAP